MVIVLLVHFQVLAASATWENVFGENIMDNLKELMDAQSKRLLKLEIDVEDAELEFDRQVSAHWHVYDWLEARTLKVVGEYVAPPTFLQATQKVVNKIKTFEIELPELKVIIEFC